MKKNKFLKLPEFPGGKAAFQKYIAENLRYPESAFQHRIEGIVHLSADVDDNGHVHDILVEKELGFGCDEEAIRLISTLRFGSVKNRGMRLKTRKKFRIKFNIEKTDNKLTDQKLWDKSEKEFTIQYTYKAEKNNAEKASTDHQPNTPANSSKYTYSISLDHKDGG